MKLAIIDLGTNSVRFDVHRISPNGKVKELLREKRMIRLGQGVFLSGRLDRDAISRALQAFTDFAQQIRKQKVDQVVAFATATLREASDSDRFLRLIEARTGIQIRVISGEEEAKLIALGILTNERGLPSRCGLIDIGGGSTEISIHEGQKDLQFCYSFPLGTARLQQVFLKSSPPSPESIDHLRQHIHSILEGVLLPQKWPKVARLVGSSGTVRTLARLNKKIFNKKTIDLKDLHLLNLRLARMTTTELLELPGMEPRRIDMILGGAILLEEVMRAIGAKRASATEYTLRDGILEEQVRKWSRDLTAVDLHLTEFGALAEKFGRPRLQSDRAMRLSHFLFTKLSKLHLLGEPWLGYLQSAAIFSGIGSYVNPYQSEWHTAYLVRNSNLIALQVAEVELISELCARVRERRVPLADLEFLRDKGHRQAFRKLLALLQLVHAVDGAHGSRAKLLDVRIKRDLLSLKFAPRTCTELDLIRLDQCRSLFSGVFARDLEVNGRVLGA